MRFFKNSNTKFYVVRPSYVYGPFQRKGTLVDLLIKAWKKKRIIKMTKCKGYRDYIYIDDVANGIIKIFGDVQTKQNNLFILKISGVWETSQHYGLTYKFIKINN